MSLSPESYHYFQTGLLSTTGRAEADHTKKFTRLSESSGDSQDTIVKYVWQEDGIEVIKTYTIQRYLYRVYLDYKVNNYSNEPYSFVPYFQLVKRDAEIERSMFDVETYSFDGGIVYDGDSYEKLYPDDLSKQPYNQTQMGGWVANI